MLEAGEDVVILDSRPTSEFTNFSIPGGVCCPGAELAYRVHDAAPSPDTTVVVNCAGRTRSIIGAQSIINAGVPNRVASLRSGTMAWHLAGLELAKGATEHAGRPSAAGLAKAGASAERVAEQFGVRTIDRATLDDWRAAAEERSLFVFDVRTRAEYEAGHLSDARWVAGGQLVQTTDEQVGTLRSRIVLVDDDGVRATMTASWLVQMGWRDAAVLAGGIEGHALEAGMPAPPVLGLDEARVESIAPGVLAAAIDRGEAGVVDLSLSRSYRSGHLPGARYAVRARLDRSLGNWSGDRLVVLTSDDEALARLAAAEANESLGVAVKVLEGGNAGWVEAGVPADLDRAGVPRRAGRRPRAGPRGRGRHGTGDERLSGVGNRAGRRRRPRRHCGMAALGSEKRAVRSWPEIRDAVTKLCERFPGEYWRALDRDRTYPTEFVQALTDAGYLSILVPEAYGGTGLPLSAARGGARGDPPCRLQRGRLSRPDVHDGHGPSPRQPGAETAVSARDRLRRAAAAGVRGDGADERQQHPGTAHHRGQEGELALRGQRPEDLDVAGGALRPDAASSRGRPPPAK